MAKNYEVLTVEGTYMWPRHEEGKYTACIAMDPNMVAKVQQAINQVNGEISDGKIHTIKLSELEGGLTGLNVKTMNAVKIYDIDGNLLELTPDSIPHGSQVACSVAISEYSMKGNTGITAYLNGVVVVKMAEAKHRDLYAEIMAGRWSK